MEKLLKLLNEYRPNSWMEYMWWIAYIWADQYSYPVDCEALTIISKEYGFIKRLVDNDKIDLEKVWKVWMTKIKWEPTSYMFDKIYSDYECLLMLLAISEQPLKDLISYLK